MFSTILKRGLMAAAGLALIATSVPAQAADPVKDFYKDKKVRVIISTNPGGGYDIYARFMTRHMAKFIPGNPRMVAQNMPGAGHRRAAQYLAYKAARDGSVIATVSQGLPFAQLVWPKKHKKIDTRKFIWIGNVNEGNNVLMLWHTSGIKTWKDLQTKAIVVGGTGAGSTSGQYPRAMNNVLGTKMKIILGFQGGPQMNLAMERGEIDGRGSNAWASIKGITPDYLKNNQVILPVQMGLTRAPDLPNVPLIWELGRNEAEIKVLKLMTMASRIGRPTLAPPGVPAARVAALRAAFDAAVSSKAFIAEATKRKLEINPVSGIEVQRVVQEILSTPPEIVALARAAVTKGKVFKCKALVKNKKMCKKKKKKKKKKKTS
jgi:tripartite-type tricarboxylate transporter receptor subunit TctC